MRFEFEDFRISGFQDFRISGFQDFRSMDLRVDRFDSSIQF